MTLAACWTVDPIHLACVSPDVKNSFLGSDQTLVKIGRKCPVMIKFPEPSRLAIFRINVVPKRKEVVGRM
jgi:hypothetical protein